MADVESTRLEAIIELKDKFSEKMKDIAKKTKEAKSKMQELKPKIEAVDETKGTIKRVKANLKALKKAKTMVGINGKDNVSKQIKKIRLQLLKLKAKKIAITVMDKASKAVNAVAAKLKKIKRKKNIKLTAEDGISPKLKGILGLLSKVGPLELTIGGAIAGTAKVVKDALASGAKMQQQEVSMEHFMGVGNKGKNQQELKAMTKQYVGQLKANANATPFETGELITTGTRALTIASGDPKKAMELVKIAEDMSASDPNKSLSDAIEALADFKVGETERMKEFGFKVSKADLDKVGGDYTKVKSQDGKTLNQTFGGLANKQADTGMGMFSTITGNMQTGVTNLGQGMLEGLKPTLAKLRDSFTNLFGNEENQNKIMQFGQKVGEVLDKVMQGVEKVSNFIKNAYELTFANVDFGAIQQAFQPAIDIFMQAYNAVKKFMDETINKSPQAQAVFATLGQIWQGVMQVVGMAVSAAAIVIKAAFIAVMAIIKAVIAVVRFFGQVWDAVKTAVSTAVNAIGSVVDTVFGAIKTAINGAKWAIDQFGEAWKWLKDKIENNPITQTIRTVKDAITGGDDSNNNTPKPRKAWGGRIPHNNYEARLHEGEKVLTKHEANKLDSGALAGNVTIVLNATVREDADIHKIIDGVVREFKKSRKVESR